MDTAAFWGAAVLSGVCTYGIRLSFIHLLDRVRTPRTVQGLLRFIPAAVLPAIVAPALWQGGEVLADPLNPRLLAGLLAVGIAWRTRNMLATIAGGMTALWALQALA